MRLLAFGRIVALVGLVSVLVLGVDPPRSRAAQAEFVTLESADGGEVVLRADADADAAVVAVVPSGAAAWLFGSIQRAEIGSWALVQDEAGRKGYVPLASVRMTAPPEPALEEDEARPRARRARKRPEADWSTRHPAASASGVAAVASVQQPLATPGSVRPTAAGPSASTQSPADARPAPALQGLPSTSVGGDEPSPERKLGPAQRVTLPPRTNEPPRLTAEQLRILDEGTRRSHRPVPDPPEASTAPRRSGRPSLPETVPVRSTPSGPSSDGPLAPTDFTVFRSTVAAPGGSLRSTTSEPSVANAGNVVFYTTNWFAAISSDGGQTFTFLNPYAFPTPPAGQTFCCDQVVIYAPAHDLFVWLLQYSTATGVNNVQRIAVATPASALANTWTFFDITSASTAFGAGFFLDYPHFALSNNFFYYTTNVFPATGAGVGTIIFRFSLNELANLTPGNTPASQQFRNTAGSFSYTPVQGATTTMYFSRSDNSGTSRPIFIWPEGVGAADVTSATVTHSSFPTATRACAGPDGLNWCGRNDSRLKGGWVAGGVIGFMWDASQGTAGLGTFAFPYTHVIRVNEATLALIDEPIIFNNNNAFQFPGVSVNGRGHLGVSIAFGGGAFHPSSMLLLRDDISPSAWTAMTVRFGANGPGADRWGDYLTTRPFSGGGNVWVGTSYTLQGPCAGGATPCANVEPRFLIFGRERDNPLCPTPRPQVGRSMSQVDANRLQVNLSTTAAGFSSITTTVLSNATLEVNGALLPVGATTVLTGTSTVIFVNRAGAPGPFTARFSIVDGCGSYPLFFGKGS